MKFKFLKRNPKLLSLIVVSLALIIIIIPLRTSLRLAVEYNDLLQQEALNTKQQPTKEQGRRGEEILVFESDPAKVIFSSLSEACQANHVLIKEVSLPFEVNAMDGLVTQHQVALEGNFVNILKSLSDISVKVKSIKIASVKFDREEDNKKIALIARIVFQSVKPLDGDDK